MLLRAWGIHIISNVLSIQVTYLYTRPRAYTCGFNVSSSARTSGRLLYVKICRLLSQNQPIIFTGSVTNLISRLHDDGMVRNGSAWHGTERLSSNVYTRLWLCGIEWFLKSNSVINYNHCQKSKWMPCLKPSVQSRKGGIRCMHKRRRAIIFS